MHKQYQVFSNQYGNWTYEGSFSARSKQDIRDYYLQGDELREYVLAFAPPADCRKMLVTSGRFAIEVEINR